MSEEKSEAFTRDVKGTSVLGDKAPQHPYYVYIDWEGNITVIRGGRH